MAKKKKASVRPTQETDDIIDLILDDHKPLKKLIKVMKDLDNGIAERRKAFKEFGPLLVHHAIPEEEVLYVRIKEEDDLRSEGFEGDVEHGLAEQMLEEAMRTTDEDLWSARVKVLAELVEHHIQEEEESLLPDFKDYSEADERAQMAEEFLAAKDNVLDDGSEQVVDDTEDENSILTVDMRS